MLFPMTSLSPMLRRRVLPAYGSSYGLLDALDQPRLVPIAEQPQPTITSDVPQDISLLPMRRPSRSVSLLDALNDTDTAPAVASGRPKLPPDLTGRGLLLGAAGASSQGKADEGVSEYSIDHLLVDPLVADAKDLWVGIRLGNSGIYKTLANAVGLLNTASDFAVRTTGYGTLSKDNGGQEVKDWLDWASTYTAPRPEEMPNTVIDKIYVGIGQAPAEVAQYLMGARLLGPVAGLASVNAVRESDKGSEAAANAAAEGAIFGLAAKALEPLNWIARTAGLAGLGATSSFAGGGDVDDAIASAAPLGLLGLFGVPRAKQPNLLPLQLAYSDFNEAAKHAQNRLDVVRGLLPKRRKQEVVQINRDPGLLLQDVARKSDELLGYKTTPGKQYKLPASPLMRGSRNYDYGRSKWWRKFEDIEVKREDAAYPPEQEFADEYRRGEGALVDLRRENEILRRARIQLGKEGQFDAEAKRLAQIIRQRARGRGRRR